MRWEEIPAGIGRIHSALEAMGAQCVLLVCRTNLRPHRSFVLVLRYCDPRYGRLPLIQAGQDVESVSPALSSLRPRVCIDGVGVSPAKRGTYERLTMSGKSYGSGISWSCKNNRHHACAKLKCACDCHKLRDPVRAKMVKKG